QKRRTRVSAPHKLRILLFFLFSQGSVHSCSRTCKAGRRSSSEWPTSARSRGQLRKGCTRLEQEAKDLILSLPGAQAFMCDVSKDEEITQLFETLKARYGKLHTLVHSVAFAPAEEMKADFVNTTREGFRVAHDVSVYSLIAVCRAAAPLMEDGGSVITMTY